MEETKTKLEVKKNERIYEFICEKDSPLGETYDSLMQMVNYVVGLIQESSGVFEKEEPINNSE